MREISLTCPSLTFISSPSLLTRSEIFRSFLCNVNSCDVWNVWVDGKREREEGEEGGREKKEGGREKREGGEVGIRFFLFTLVCKFST